MQLRSFFFREATDYSVLLTYSSIHITAISSICLAIMFGGARVIAKKFVPSDTWTYFEKYKVLFKELLN